MIVVDEIAVELDTLETDFRMENNKEMMDEMQYNKEGETVANIFDELDEKLSIE